MEVLRSNSLKWIGKDEIGGFFKRFRWSKRPSLRLRGVIGDLKHLEIKFIG